MRSKWCSALNTDSFSAGILSSQRSESTNNAISFKANKHTSLTQFFKLFDDTMEHWRTTKVDDEFKRKTTSPALYSYHSILIQASKIYNAY